MYTCKTYKFIHKHAYSLFIFQGDGYGGTGGQTVVTDERHMSPRWRNRGGHDVSGSTVGDFVKAGGRDYSLCTDNCHDGRDRMLDLP